MAFSFGDIPNSLSGQFFDDLSFTYADRDSGLNFLGHESATPPASSHYLAPSPSGTDASFYVPPRRTSTRHPDPKHIPRPRNAFIFFRSWYINNNRDSKDVQQNELSKQAGKAWNSMSEEAKRPFMQLAAAEKEHHYNTYPDYVYSPSTKSGGNPTGSQKTKGKRRSPSAYDDIASRTTSDPSKVTSASWYHSGEGFSFEQGPPSPFHAHLDSVPSQFAYQQNAHDFMPSYMPTLPNTFDMFNQSSNSMSLDIPASDPSAYSRYSGPSSLTCENPYPSTDYLALLEHPFSEETYNCEDMMQRCIDEVLAATFLEFSGGYYGQNGSAFN
ncbi:Transcription factor sem-2 [Psilocybe cubensis]|uniref:Transcription factor sem-2 n=2 Tax=Psilocybe cubensis TaxID=181762 RepID=A0ACB8H5P9_PSICU|nr:Transcription factor sem-2 [Psilocybe cubensis]KAH9483044.1 Transcription factor sem-2 [Psilocybe cubensis]